MGVQQEVEAALLNSEDEPEQEIQRALVAVVKFAKKECEMKDRALKEMLVEALEHAKEEEEIE